MNSSKLILIRHGQSIWNKLNLFTGWVDVGLSKEGTDEAIRAGEEIRDIEVDVIFTSTLIRAHMTLFLAMMDRGKVPVFVHEEGGKERDWGTIYNKESEKNSIPIYRSWHLNERMYGKLQGFNKDDMRKKYGKEQVKVWRRSYRVAPPDGESLADTAERTLPYFKDKVVPFLKGGKNVLISAHGNSLRAIVMYLDNLGEGEVVKLEIPTGEPLIYEYSGGKFEKKR